MLVLILFSLEFKIITLLE